MAKKTESSINKSMDVYIPYEQGVGIRLRLGSDYGDIDVKIMKI